MTDDIVARLRRLSNCDDDWVYTCAQEAADEIERLREALHEYGEHRPACYWRMGHGCNCGWAAALAGRAYNDVAP